MILFFYGPNDFMVARAVDQLKNRYLKNVGDLNLLSLDGAQIELNEFLREVQAVPLLASTRLIIIKNIFDHKDKTISEKIEQALAKVPSSSVVVFSQTGEPDKRRKLFKTLASQKGSKRFDFFSPAQTASFIKKEVALKNGAISDEAAGEIADFCSHDLWRIDNEIAKLLSYKDGEKIEIADVQELVSRNVVGNSFHLADAVVAGNKKVALENLLALLESNEPPLKIMGLIVYQFRVLTQVFEASQRQSNKFAIAKQLSLNPFQVEKLLPRAKKLDYQSLSRIYTRLSLVDEKIKNGTIEPTEALKDFILQI